MRLLSGQVHSATALQRRLRFLFMNDANCSRGGDSSLVGRCSLRLEKKKRGQGHSHARDRATRFSSLLTRQKLRLSDALVCHHTHPEGTLIRLNSTNSGWSSRAPRRSGQSTNVVDVWNRDRNARMVVLQRQRSCSCNGSATSRFLLCRLAIGGM